MKFKKLSMPLVALLQALAVVVYCSLVALFIMWTGELMDGPGGIWQIILSLCLLVVSAAVTGFLVFGYPIYLFLDKEVKKALNLLSYTFLFLILTIIIILLIII
ncbi:hypothetical protein HOD19_03115 [bacterium]|nr:hypothetical protein [bacterium]